MSIITINGVELELDLLDADIVERYEDALRMVEDACESARDEELKLAEEIRRQCHIIFDFFNETFGEGTDKKIFGSKVNLGVCMDAFDIILNEASKQQDNFSNRVNKYNPNRAQRRAK